VVVVVVPEPLVHLWWAGLAATTTQAMVVQD
jgi:hypothetical protein